MPQDKGGTSGSHATHEAHSGLRPSGFDPGRMTYGFVMALRECPIGLFWSGEELCLKTEYGNNEGRIDAYIVSTGEFFWGSPPQSIASQREELVEPIDTDDAIAALTQLDELRARYDERLTDLQMLAFKWMDAHDKLKAGLPYELPKPADVPDTMAQLDELRAENERLKSLIERAYKEGHNCGRADPIVYQSADEDWQQSQARKALGGTNDG